MNPYTPETTDAGTVAAATPNAGKRRRQPKTSPAKKNSGVRGFFSEPPKTPAVMIIDDNLGFVWWLGEILTKAGCTVVPASSCQDALALSKRPGVKVDLVFVNPDLEGRKELIEKLARVHHILRIADLTDPPA